ncbi:MAG: lytic murein transglycosylase [Deltaproteobacteria bacterium]|nr:lytic murein transglycosylase [Deltaproteobacteria bacterium]
MFQIFSIIRWDTVRSVVPLLVTLTLLLCLSIPQAAAQQREVGFEEWLEELKKRAVKQGISPDTVYSALSGVKFLPRVVELDRNQPEDRLNLQEYLARISIQQKSNMGRKLLRRHNSLLGKVYQQYGVQPQFIVALWGVETNFGRLKGRFSVIEALATLAYDGRRERLFARELLYALRIIDEGHISIERLKGSWAGAIGQIQFMPSTFHNFAVDYDGDGRKDIWDNLGDAFASAANYLARSGWEKDQDWGHEVKLPRDFDTGHIGLEVKKNLQEWRDLGVRPFGGFDPEDDSRMMASVIRPDGEKGRTFLVFDNFRVILKWNRSLYFGVAVGLLAHAITQ